MAFSTFRPAGTPYSDRKRRRLPPEQPRGDQRPTGGFRVGQGAPRREAEGEGTGSKLLGAGGKVGGALAKEALNRLLAPSPEHARNPESEAAYQEARAGERADLGAAGSVGGADLSQFFGPDFSNATFSMPTGGESLLTAPSTVPVGAIDPSSLGGSIGAGMGSSAGAGAAPGATGSGVGGMGAGLLSAGAGALPGLINQLVGGGPIGGMVSTALSPAAAAGGAALGSALTGGVGGAASGAGAAAGASSAVGGAAAGAGLAALPAAVVAIATSIINHFKDKQKQREMKRQENYMSNIKNVQLPGGQRMTQQALQDMPQISPYMTDADIQKAFDLASRVSSSRDIAVELGGMSGDYTPRPGKVGSQSRADVMESLMPGNAAVMQKALQVADIASTRGRPLPDWMTPENMFVHTAPASAYVPEKTYGPSFRSGNVQTENPAYDPSNPALMGNAPLMWRGAGTADTGYGDFSPDLKSTMAGWGPGGLRAGLTSMLAPYGGMVGTGGGGVEGGPEATATGKRGSSFAPAVGAVSEEAPKVGAAPGEGVRPEADLIKEAFGRRPGGMGIAPGGGAAGRSPFGVASQQNQRPQRNTTSTV